jgi:hypothetical protein
VVGARSDVLSPVRGNCRLGRIDEPSALVNPSALREVIALAGLRHDAALSDRGDRPFASESRNVVAASASDEGGRGEERTYEIRCTSPVLLLGPQIVPETPPGLTGKSVLKPS